MVLQLLYGGGLLSRGGRSPVPRFRLPVLVVHKGEVLRVWPAAAGRASCPVCGGGVWAVGGGGGAAAVRRGAWAWAWGGAGVPLMRISGTIFVILSLS